MELPKWSADVDKVLKDLETTFLSLTPIEVEVPRVIEGKTIFEKKTILVSKEGELPLLTKQEAKEIISLIKPIFNKAVIYSNLSETDKEYIFRNLHKNIWIKLMVFRERRKRRDVHFDIVTWDEKTYQVKIDQVKAQPLDISVVKTLTEAIMILIKSTITRSGHEIERWKDILDVNVKENLEIR